MPTNLGNVESSLALHRRWIIWWPQSCDQPQNVGDETP
jgi:hypothetical protein